jgi:prepilin peptidase CpaA
MSVFFPDPLFGWAYLVALFGLLAAAAWRDLRAMVIPKQLTVPTLALGVLFNAVRGGWLGAEGHPAWVLGANGPVVGALDGLLFALGGFALAFALFFLMWFLGVCGGGDVKLFAAFGAWVGPERTLIVMLVTIFVVFFFIMGRLVLRLFSGDWKAVRKAANARPLGRPGEAGRHARKHALGFALPLAIAAVLVLLWSFRVELHMAAAPAQDDSAKEHARAR